MICPRCNEHETDRYYGPCDSCREQLRRWEAWLEPLMYFLTQKYPSSKVD